MCTTSCRQESSANFHAAGQERAAAELASLYEHIKNMPDGPQKTHFLKKVCYRFTLCEQSAFTIYFPTSLSAVHLQSQPDLELRTR